MFNQETSAFEPPVKISFVTGLQNTWAVFGRKIHKEVEALDFSVHPQYLAGDIVDHDFGLVKLDTPIGETTGWASVRVYEESQLSNLRINILQGTQPLEVH